MIKSPSDREELSQWRGWRRFDRMLARYAVITIAVLALVFLTFDWVEQLNASLRTDERVRFDAHAVMALQLDEETGLRGYDATRSPIFLQPFEDARVQMKPRLKALSTELGSETAKTALANFRSRHDAWEVSVARPLLLHPGSAASASKEQLGKKLVDGMRSDVERIDRAYDQLGKSALFQAHIFTYVCAGLIFTVIALVAIFAYASERRAAAHEETLLLDVMRKRDSATRLSDWRAKVVAMLAHDFKSTLGVIRGYCTILRDLPDRRADGEIYRGIDEAVAELAEMSDEALLMARVSGGTLQVARECVPISTIVERVVKRYGDRRDIAFEAADLHVLGDRTYLLRVFDNLIGNAVKYSHNGSPIEVRVNRAGDGVAVSVSDRGKGINAKDLPHIFEEYWRSPEAQSSKGSGVGLFIVKKLVEAHGGTVSAKSRAGEGTTICVTLPSAGDVSSTGSSAVRGSTFQTNDERYDYC